MVDTRSSIKSRSTSQYFSDESSRLCIGSSWLISSSFVIAPRDALENLLVFCSFRLELGPFNLFRLDRSALINDSPFSSFPSFTFGSSHDITPVVIDLLR